MNTSYQIKFPWEEFSQESNCSYCSSNYKVVQIRTWKTGRHLKGSHLLNINKKFTGTLQTAKLDLITFLRRFEKKRDLIY